MFDNSQRSLWGEQAYTDVCKEFGFESKQILVGVSYPPSGARGDLARVHPAHFDTQWRGNDNEKDGFLGIHPLSFATPADALRAILWICARTHYGVRHGAAYVGLRKLPNAKIAADSATQARLDAILARIGDPPPGFAEPFPVRQVNRGRMRAYHCACATDNKVYRSNDSLDATCNHCGQLFTKL